VAEGELRSTRRTRSFSGPARGSRAPWASTAAPSAAGSQSTSSAFYRFSNSYRAELTLRTDLRPLGGAHRLGRGAALPSFARGSRAITVGIRCRPVVRSRATVRRSRSRHGGRAVDSPQIDRSNLILSRARRRRGLCRLLLMSVVFLCRAGSRRPVLATASLGVFARLQHGITSRPPPRRCVPDRRHRGLAQS